MTHFDVIIDRLEFIKGNVIADERRLAIQQINELLDYLLMISEPSVQESDTSKAS